MKNIEIFKRNVKELSEKVDEPLWGYGGFLTKFYKKGTGEFYPTHGKNLFSLNKNSPHSYEVFLNLAIVLYDNNIDTAVAIATAAIGLERFAHILGINTKQIELHKDNSIVRYIDDFNKEDFEDKNVIVLDNDISTGFCMNQIQNILSVYNPQSIFAFVAYDHGNSKLKKFDEKKFKDIFLANKIKEGISGIDPIKFKEYMDTAQKRAIEYARVG